MAYGESNGYVTDDVTWPLTPKMDLYSVFRSLVFFGLLQVFFLMCIEQNPEGT